MNLYAPAGYDELISRLALGIEAVDAARGQPIVAGLALGPDQAALRRPFERRSGGRFALLHDRRPATADE
ncbi:MAG TPA: hypothetical protein VF744_00700, partial [Beijerinckiaceae bacterium]